jgi:hypothetical protein
MFPMQLVLRASLSPLLAPVRRRRMMWIRLPVADLQPLPTGIRRIARTAAPLAFLLPCSRRRVPLSMVGPTAWQR